MDGTLVDSQPGIVEAMNATLRELGEPERDPEDLRARIGPPLPVTIATLLGRRVDEVDAIVAAYRDRYRQTMRDGTFVYPGIPELLADLAAAEHPMAVATSKAQPWPRSSGHLGPRPGSRRSAAPCRPPEDKAGTIARALDALDTRTAVLVGDRHHDVTGAVRRAGHDRRRVGLRRRGRAVGGGRALDRLPARRGPRAAGVSATGARCGAGAGRCWPPP
jgi:phosphoglycolate phosphatase